MISSRLMLLLLPLAGCAQTPARVAPPASPQADASGLRLLASRSLAPVGQRRRVLAALDLTAPADAPAATEAIGQTQDGSLRSCIAMGPPPASFAIDPADGRCRARGGVAAGPAIR